MTKLNKSKVDKSVDCGNLSNNIYTKTKKEHKTNGNAKVELIGLYDKDLLDVVQYIYSSITNVQSKTEKNEVSH